MTFIFSLNAILCFIVSVVESLTHDKRTDDFRYFFVLFMLMAVAATIHVKLDKLTKDKE